MKGRALQLNTSLNVYYKIEYIVYVHLYTADRISQN